MRKGWRAMRVAMLRRGAEAMIVLISVCSPVMRLEEWARWPARLIPGRCDRWYGALAVKSGVAQPGRLV